MKTTNFVIVLFFVFCTIGFSQSQKNVTKDHTSVSIRESEAFYQLSADYDPSKTRKVQTCMDDHLNEKGDASFKNAQLDATMTLTDKTTFYIKSSPGKLSLKFNKKQNSSASYVKFKKLGEGLKSLLDEQAESE